MFMFGAGHEAARVHALPHRTGNIGHPAHPPAHPDKRPLHESGRADGEGIWQADEAGSRGAPCATLENRRANARRPIASTHMILLENSPLE